MELKKHKSDWDSIGGIDPMWAILSDHSKKFGKWDTDEFFRSGKEAADTVVRLMEINGYPREREKALDFGCGVGRVTRFFAHHFAEVVGIDVADTMVTKARELNAAITNCTFMVNDKENLELFRDNSFDLVYSYIVLQHVPSRQAIDTYVAEFLRILKPNGLLLFQLPASLPLLIRLQPRRTLYTILKRFGFRDDTLYWKLGLHPIRMNYIPEAAMIRFLESNGGMVVSVEKERDDRFPIESNVYLVTKK
jgi:ubiquinone/menaquinone biosynthesis C-methylase UbiE